MLDSYLQLLIYGTFSTLEINEIKMFQMSLVKLFLVILVAASLGAFWFLDSVFYHWDRVLPQPEETVVETVPESSKNVTTFNKPKEFVPTNEWQIIDGGI